MSQKLLLFVSVALFMVSGDALGQISLESEWEYPSESGKVYYTFRDFYDIDEDGIIEMAIEQRAYLPTGDVGVTKIEFMDYSTRAIKWTLNAESGKFIEDGPAGFLPLVDLNGDEAKEVLVVEREHATSSDSSPFSRIVDLVTGANILDLGEGYVYQDCKDVDGDGELELIFKGWDIGKFFFYSTGVLTNIGGKEGASKPSNFKLGQNHPNPFNPVTNISYQVSSPGKVTIKIFNSIGQEVRTLLDKSQEPGEYSMQWDGKGNNGEALASGTYFYQMQVGGFISAKKALLLK